MLTKREKELIEAIKHHLYVKDAAHTIGISERTAYNMLYRIRRKYKRAREFVNQILSLRRAHPIFDKLLSLKTPLWKEIRELEEMQREEESEG